MKVSIYITLALLTWFIGDQDKPIRFRKGDIHEYLYSRYYIIGVGINLKNLIGFVSFTMYCIKELRAIVIKMKSSDYHKLHKAFRFLP